MARNRTVTPVIDDDPPEMGVVFRSNRLVRGTLIARPVWRKANRPMAKFAGIVGIVRGRDSQRVSQLKIRIEQIHGNLGVHVIEARQLSSKWTTACNAFVQVFVASDDTPTSQWMSNVIYNTNTPAFHQGADIELRPGDEKKRLIILLFHMDTEKNCNEFLGCMSFGIRHLKSKSKRKAGVEGWYYLLSKELGFRKHLSASDDTKSITAAGSLDSRPSLEGTANGHPSDLNLCKKKIQGLESRTLVIYKKNHGYGFTVKNTCPVRVGRVKPCGPSEEAGLLKGDYIKRINGQNVSMASAQSVAEIVRRSAKFLIVDIWRLPAKASSRSSAHKCSPSSQAYSTVSDSEMSTKVDVQLTNNCPSDSQTGGYPAHRSVESIHGFHQTGQSGKSFYSTNHPGSTSQKSGQSGFEFHDSSQSVGSERSDDENIPPGGSDLTYKSQPRMKPLGKHRLNESGEFPQRKSSHYGLDYRLDYDNSFESSGKSADSKQSSLTSVPSSHSIKTCSDYARSALKMQADGISDSELTKWDPEISIIETSETARHYVSSYCDLDISDVHQQLHGSGRGRASWARWGEETSQSSSPPQQDYVDESLFASEDNRVIESSDEVLDKGMLPGYSSIEDSALGSSHSSTKSASDDGRVGASGAASLGGASGSGGGGGVGGGTKTVILRLVSAEREFAELMQHGIQQYSRPLRHGLLTPEQHIMVFQNIEKLVALSEYNIHQFEESYSAVSVRNPLLTDNLIAEEIADIYSTRVRLLCNTYKSYLDGLPAASEALRNLYNKRNIRKFLHSQCLSNFTIENFLEQPKQHLMKLTENFRDIVKLLKPQSGAHRELKLVVNVNISEVMFTSSV
ncbi:hypothetical protein LSH36_398g00006 [Paralvinella palmiformis]|uniref:Uncharacterized protein n=1 Tax=Paralvinella palmiformis TaxID=53620 RepID=A0AAD9JCH6_9ANNE|nr:hypothetical protein LSH36_398g00006 [Paralvinella palmiformis]